MTVSQVNTFTVFCSQSARPPHLATRSAWSAFAASRRKQGRKRAAIFCRLRPSSSPPFCVQPALAVDVPTCSLQLVHTTMLHNFQLAQIVGLGRLTSCINMAKLLIRAGSHRGPFARRADASAARQRAVHVWRATIFHQLAARTGVQQLVLASCRRACARAGMCAAASDACFSDRAANASARRTGPCASGAGTSPRVASSPPAGPTCCGRVRPAAVCVRRLPPRGARDGSNPAHHSTCTRAYSALIACARTELRRPALGRRCEASMLQCLAAARPPAAIEATARRPRRRPRRKPSPPSLRIVRGQLLQVLHPLDARSLSAIVGRDVLWLIVSHHPHEIAGDFCGKVEDTIS